MTTLRSVHDVPDVPIPSGFSADDWADLTDRPFRTLWGPQRVIGDEAAVVRASLMQYADGTLPETDDDNEGPAIHIDICSDWGLTRREARELAGAILAVAHEADEAVGA